MCPSPSPTPPRSPRRATWATTWRTSSCSLLQAADYDVELRRARHHLYRRDRQDRPQEREYLHHARRLRRGRAAGAAEDPRGHGGQRSAAGRTQAPAPGVHPDRHARTSSSSAAARSTGLDKIIEQPSGPQEPWASARTSRAGRERDVGRSCCSEVQPHDLLKFGIIPELVGRLPVIARARRAAARTIWCAS